MEHERDAAEQNFLWKILGSLHAYCWKNGVRSVDLSVVDDFIGPKIRNSGYRTSTEFRDAVFGRYQQFYDGADAIVQRQVTAGTIANNPLVVCGRTDMIARFRLRSWLWNTEGIQEGSNSIISVNRWLRDPAGSGAYRIPDVRIGGANIIFDGTLATSPPKSALTPLIIDYRGFSGGNIVIGVRPTRLGDSYGIIP